VFNKVWVGLESHDPKSLFQIEIRVLAAVQADIVDQIVGSARESGHHPTAPLRRW
jgi:hypothetical protein